MATPSVFLPGETHGQRSLAGYSLWGYKEPDTTESRRAMTDTRAGISMPTTPRRAMP